MIEPEIAFADLAEDMIKYIFQYVLENATQEWGIGHFLLVNRLPCDILLEDVDHKFTEVHGLHRAAWEMAFGRETEDGNGPHCLFNRYPHVQ